MAEFIEEVAGGLETLLHHSGAIFLSGLKQGCMRWLWTHPWFNRSPLLIHHLHLYLFQAVLSLIFRRSMDQFLQALFSNRDVFI